MISMSTEENKAIARRFIEQVWNERDMALVQELFAPDVVRHDSASPTQTEIHGLEKMKQMISTVSRAFPDLYQTLDDQIAEGDKVVNRWTARGTHQGAYMGIAPTGKSITFTGITIFRIAEGKIVEQWVEQDMVGFLQQLGVMPSPGQ